ncbi:MAG: hypothetical protein ACYTG0_40690 [Planctomycetota bacterium]|jgi:hypothetical protein
MTRHAIWICLVSGVLVSGSGCCAVRSLIMCPFGRCIPVCESACCGDPTCAGDCGPVCGSPCGMACEPACGPVCGDPCGDPCCDPCGAPYCATPGPLSWLFSIFTHGFCGEQCGELYWSDFHSDPPDCCDPCDRLGNWSGGPSAAGCLSCSGDCGSCRIAGSSDPAYSARVAPGRATSGHGLSAGEMPGGYVSHRAGSRYAPRLISVTDEAVSPAAPQPTIAEAISTHPTPARPTPARQVTQPRRAPPRQ